MKILMLSGLPASGKSTYAADLVKQGNWIRVNRDLLRTMLHFDKWSGPNEEMTVAIEQIITAFALKAGKSVVVDDCNLNPKNKTMWMNLVGETAGVTDFKHKFEHKHFDTSWQECVQRDLKREKPVGAHVIVQMALQYGLYETPKKGFVIVDIDGTIANGSHREHHLTDGDKKDWGKYFGEMSLDLPRGDVIDRLEVLYREGYEIIFVSGRPDTYRKDTEDWFEKHNLWYRLDPITILMRRGGDKRPDTDVKREIFNRYLAKYPIHCVFDDRPSVIELWRNMGLTVEDVGKGIAF